MHFDKLKDLVNVYSRNLENMTETYPDACEFLKSYVNDDITNFIFDCEIVPYDMENHKILPFQVLTTRSKKNVNVSDVKI